jgi:hypothetical protein
MSSRLGCATTVDSRCRLCVRCVSRKCVVTQCGAAHRDTTSRRKPCRGITGAPRKRANDASCTDRWNHRKACPEYFRSEKREALRARESVGSSQTVSPLSRKPGLCSICRNPRSGLLHRGLYISILTRTSNRSRIRKADGGCKTTIIRITSPTIPASGSTPRKSGSANGAMNRSRRLRIITASAVPLAR